MGKYYKILRWKFIVIYFSNCQTEKKTCFGCSFGPIRSLLTYHHNKFSSQDNFQIYHPDDMKRFLIWYICSRFCLFFKSNVLRKVLISGYGAFCSCCSSTRFSTLLSREFFSFLWTLITCCQLGNFSNETFIALKLVVLTMIATRILTVVEF